MYTEASVPQLQCKWLLQWFGAMVDPAMVDAMAVTMVDTMVDAMVEEPRRSPTFRSKCATAPSSHASYLIPTNRHTGTRIHTLHPHSTSITYRVRGMR